NRQERRLPLPEGVTLKNFDVVVSPPEGPNWIVDVKGRLFPGGGGKNGPRFWKNWTTRDDLTGLLRWETIMGAEYRERSAFVFAYFAAGERKPGPPEELFRYRGGEYAFYAISVKKYLGEARLVSPRWGTFEIPPGRFCEIATPARRFFGG
ncbi:MAG: HYExAFE family protein, partial [Thermoguttaceae bacterium]|nr:HYExAFE family protein [Thermoguttaceae bacterium]